MNENWYRGIWAESPAEKQARLLLHIDSLPVNLADLDVYGYV